MLQWFSEDSVVAKALSGRLIEENEEETRPERVSSSCLDENVAAILQNTMPQRINVLLTVKEIMDYIVTNPIIIPNVCN